MDGGIDKRRSLWDILGTEPTGDERALKRAYAKRLKVTRPEDDPVAFQELRDAYEYALHHAPRFAEELAQMQDEPQDTAPVVMPEPVPAPVPAPGPQVDMPAQAPAAELWGTVELVPEQAPAELWGVIDTPAPPPAELWGVLPIDIEAEAASLWIAFTEHSRHRDAATVLQELLRDQAMLNLAVREQFEWHALRYCAAQGYTPYVRDTLFDALGWHDGMSYLACNYGELVRCAVQHYRADRSFTHFNENRDSYPGLDCILSFQEPSAYFRPLLDAEFAARVAQLLQLIRWQHPEMLAYRLDTALFERWEQTLSRPRYYRQTAMASVGLGMALHFMLSGVAKSAGMVMDNTAAYTSLIGLQVLAFLLLGMQALRRPRTLFDSLQVAREQVVARLPLLGARPALLQLGWIVPFLLCAILLCTPQPGATQRLLVSSALCVTTLLSVALNRHIVHGAMLGSMLGFSLFAGLFTAGQGAPALAISDGMMLTFCLALLVLRCSVGLVIEWGIPDTLLSRLRQAWGCSIVVLIPVVLQAGFPAPLAAALLFSWSCAGLLLLGCDLNRSTGVAMITATIASALLSAQQTAFHNQPLMRLSVALTLFGFYLLLLQCYRHYAAKSRP